MISALSRLAMSSSRGCRINAGALIFDSRRFTRHASALKCANEWSGVENVPAPLESPPCIEADAKRLLNDDHHLQR